MIYVVFATKTMILKTPFSKIQVYYWDTRYRGVKGIQRFRNEFVLPQNLLWKSFLVGLRTTQVLVKNILLWKLEMIVKTFLEVYDNYFATLCRNISCWYKTIGWENPLCLQNSFENPWMGYEMPRRRCWDRKVVVYEKCTLCPGTYWTTNNLCDHIYPHMGRGVVI